MRSLAVVLVLGACGAEQPTTPPDHIATLHVTLEGDGSLDPTHIRLAIVWWRDTAVWPARALEPQDLFIDSFTLTWPVTFDAFLTTPPTYDPYWSPPSVGYRSGRLVAYIDDNANGQLDFTPIDATAFTDRIVGYAAGTAINYYTTVDGIAQNIYVPNVGPTDVDIATPLTLPQRSTLRQSCHMLADWRPYFEYQSVFGGIPIDPNDPSSGPWDREAASDARCPNNLVPPLTQAISCDVPAPLYEFHAEEIAQPSAFIASTCGEVMRVCEGWRPDPNAPGPWPCPCDTTKYRCVDVEGGL